MAEMTKAQLEEKVNKAVEKANNAIKNVKCASIPEFSSSMDKWVKIIQDNAQTKTGEKTWKSIKSKSGTISDSISTIKGFSCSSEATGSLSSKVIERVKEE